jgi:hypothetical protein
VAEYPNLELTQLILRSSLYMCKRDEAPIGPAMEAVLAEELTADAEQILLATDPAVLILNDALPDILSETRKAQGVAHLCRGITEPEDWKTRFACLNLAMGYADRGHRDTVEPAIEALASSGLDTPDVVRAICIMSGFSTDLDERRVWGDALLNLGRIIDVPNRTLHEEVRKAIEYYAQALYDGGRAKEAAEVYDRLGAKFPNSALERRCAETAAAIRSGQRPPDAP